MTAEGDEPDPDLRELQFLKSNYGPLAGRVLVRWRNGVFLPSPARDRLRSWPPSARSTTRFSRSLIASPTLAAS